MLVVVVVSAASAGVSAAVVAAVIVVSAAWAGVSAAVLVVIVAVVAAAWPAIRATAVVVVTARRCGARATRVVRMLGFVASGRHLAKAELHVTRGGGHSGRDAWLAVIMRDVVITSVSTSGVSDGSVAQEVAMDFRSMAVEYRRQQHDGSLASPAKFEWDIATGVSSTSP